MSNLSDTEIIKAFKCLCGEEIFCRECKYSGHIYYPECRQQVAKDTLDLINRLKEENEEKDILLEASKMTNEILGTATESFKLQLEMALEQLKTAKSEARKEFAERLKRRMGFCDLPNVIVRDHIDNLLKEMG